MQSRRLVALGISAVLGLASTGILTAPAFAQGQNGTTLTAHKTATGFNEVVYPWAIEKSVSPAVIDMFEGDTASVNYTVSVHKGEPVTRSGVTGSVCVTNGGAVATENLSIEDWVYGHPSNKTVLFKVPVDTSAKPVLQPGEDHCYPYSYLIDSPVGQVIKDDAVITITNHSGWLGQPFGASPSATTTMPAPTVVNDTINVDDSNGDSWSFSESAAVSYPAEFAAAGVYDNTATIRETGDAASASVTVNTYALEVAKTAGTSWNRDWTWTIDKSVDQTNLTLPTDEIYPVNWTVTVNPASADSGHAVAGTITITNPAPIAASLTAVTDSFGELGIDVDCPSLSVAANSQLECSYSQALSGPIDGVNTATATLQNHAWAADGSATATSTTNYQGTADVVFSPVPSVETDECVSVTDTLAGELGQVCAGDSVQSFNYSTNVGPYQYPGTYSVNNVATFMTNDTDTTGSDDATVTITVPAAGGCTLTQGYWKTHSALGPAPYDQAWLNLGPLGQDRIFYASGATWYQTFMTPPKGNAYYNLAHQYMAAKLNVLNGAATTPEVAQTIDSAEALFSSLSGTSLTRTQSTLAKKLAGTLDSYNNGLIGPGHCSEPPTVS